MKTSDEPLMRQLFERDMGKMDLLRSVNLSTTTLSKLGKNQLVKLEIMWIFSTREFVTLVYVFIFIFIDTGFSTEFAYIFVAVKL